jgi:hypothetical protein
MLSSEGMYEESLSQSGAESNMALRCCEKLATESSPHSRYQQRLPYSTFRRMTFRDQYERNFTEDVLVLKCCQILEQKLYQPA